MVKTNTNYAELRGLIKSKCGTQQRYAEQIGISATSLSHKLNGKVEFAQHEIKKTKALFDLSPEDVCRIFFTY